MRSPRLRDSYRTGCMGKFPFPTYTEAERRVWVMNRRTKRRDARDGHLVPYKCLCCPWFHVGNESLRSMALRRRRRLLKYQPPREEMAA